jgi:glutathione S-transferase
MITLYGFGPNFGLPEVSPYVTKTEVQLKMAGLGYRKTLAMPMDSPKGQLPFIEDEGERVADSTFIRAHIERKYGIDLAESLDSRQRAESWAIERMIENQMTWATVYERWIMPENFARGPARFFDGAPEAMREQVRTEAQGRVRDALRAVGIARHTPEEIAVLGTRSLGALSLFLGDKPFLMGQTPTALDATAFGALAALQSPLFEGPFHSRARDFPNLTAYVDRLMGRYYPDHAWGRG